MLTERIDLLLDLLLDPPLPGVRLQRYPTGQERRRQRFRPFPAALPPATSVVSDVSLQVPVEQGGATVDPLAEHARVGVGGGLPVPGAAHQAVDGDVGAGVGGRPVGRRDEPGVHLQVVAQVVLAGEDDVADGANKDRLGRAGARLEKNQENKSLEPFRELASSTT